MSNPLLVHSSTGTWWTGRASRRSTRSMPPSLNGVACGAWRHFGHACAQHPIAADVLAVLVIDVMRRVRRADHAARRVGVGDAAGSIERPSVEAPRTPTDAAQRVVVRVVNHRADVIRYTRDFRGFHRPRIDAVDDRAAIRPIFGDRDPDEFAVVIQTAGVIDRAFTEPKIGQPLAAPSILTGDRGPAPASRSYPPCGGANGVGRVVTSTDDTKNVSPIFTMPCG